MVAILNATLICFISSMSIEMCHLFLYDIWKPITLNNRMEFLTSIFTHPVIIIIYSPMAAISTAILLFVTAEWLPNFNHQFVYYI